MVAAGNARRKLVAKQISQKERVGQIMKQWRFLAHVNCEYQFHPSMSLSAKLGKLFLGKDYCEDFQLLLHKLISTVCATLQQASRLCLPKPERRIQQYIHIYVYFVTVVQMERIQLILGQLLQNILYLFQNKLNCFIKQN